jgi:hypothetical protein
MFANFHACLRYGLIFGDGDTERKATFKLQIISGKLTVDRYTGIWIYSQ